MIEVERKCKKNIRLTIAHDGKIRLKIPAHLSDEHAKRIEVRAAEIVEEKGPQKKTLRMNIRVEDIP